LLHQTNRAKRLFPDEPLVFIFVNWDLNCTSRIVSKLT